MSDFEFSAGALCLDFANTWGYRLDPETDRLSGFDDLLEWALGAGIVTSGERHAFSDIARQMPSEAEKIYNRALALRETIFRIVSAAAAGRPPKGSDVEDFNRALTEAPRQRLAPGGECCRWECSGDRLDLGRMIWPVIRSAADLMTSAGVSRIRECGAPDCSWLFVDTSKGGRRRWCDMGTCGNRAKARRYYERHHKQA